MSYFAAGVMAYIVNVLLLETVFLLQITFHSVICVVYITSASE